MAWSLTYLVAKKHLAELLRYYQALNTLPRDMECGDESLLDVFVGAFDLSSAGSDEFRKLALEWFAFTSDTANGIEVQEAYNVAKEKEDIRVKKLLAEAEAKKKEAQVQGQLQPNQPIQPGFRTAPGMPQPAGRGGKFGGQRPGQRGGAGAPGSSGT